MSTIDFYGEVPSIPGGHVTDGQATQSNLLDTVGKGGEGKEGVVGIHRHHFLGGTFECNG